MLNQINLAHFAFAFLGAYLTYQSSTVWGFDPLWTLVLIIPCFFLVGMAMHWVFARFEVTAFSSLLITFGVTVVIESVIQWFWTADFRKLESHHAEIKWKIGAFYVPWPELLTLILAVGLSLAIWALLRHTDLGRALRAAAEDAPIAAAFGVNQRRLALILSGTGTALAGIAGVCLALGFTLAPSQIYAWIGVVFAAVMIGGLGNPLGPLLAGVTIGVAEALTMAVTSPAWAPLVSFSLLILVLLLRPNKP